MVQAPYFRFAVVSRLILSSKERCGQMMTMRESKDYVINRIEARTTLQFVLQLMETFYNRDQFIADQL